MLRGGGRRIGGGFCRARCFLVGGLVVGRGGSGGRCRQGRREMERGMGYLPRHQSVGVACAILDWGEVIVLV